MKKGIIAIIIIFIVTILIVKYTPNINQDYVKSGKLYISKILAINTRLKEDNNGEYSDYLEIYNGYSFPVNLSGYHLSDDEYTYNKWTFPDIEIKPKESLIIYATGNDYCDLTKDVCHTNFKLSGSGEVILLSDNFGNIISKVKYGMQYPDTLYVYKNGKYNYVNSEGKIVKKSKENGYKYQLEITEYMTHNKNSYYDMYGNYYDFVEIYNKSDNDYSLEGLYISDDINNLKKYLLPNVIINKKDYLIIHFNSNDKSYDKGVYINFGLSDNDKEIIISDGSKIIDKVDIVKLSDDVSYGKIDNKWYYFTKPTPGYLNNTYGFTTWGGNDEDS